MQVGQRQVRQADNKWRILAAGAFCAVAVLACVSLAPDAAATNQNGICALKFLGSASPAITAGATIPSSTMITDFGGQFKFSSGDSVVALTFPGGTVFSPSLAASDFVLQQKAENRPDTPVNCNPPVTGTASNGQALAPAAISLVGNKILFTPNPASVTSHGWGAWQVSTSASGGGKITHPAGICPGLGSVVAAIPSGSQAMGPSSIQVNIVGNPPASTLQSTIEAESYGVMTGGTSIITVRVKNAAGACLSGESVSASTDFGTFVSTGTSTASGTTNSLGIASFSLTSSSAGTATVSATSPNLAQTATVVFGSPILRFVQGPSSSGIGLPLAPRVSVAVVDASGNVVTTATNTVTLALVGGPTGARLVNGPGQATSPQGVNPSAALASGLVSFPSVAVDTPGVYRMVATASGLAAAISEPFAISGTGPDWPMYHQGPSHASTAPGGADLGTPSVTTVSVPGGDTVASPVIADLNGDGRLDIAAVTNMNSASTGTAVTVYAFFQDSSGFFPGATSPNGWTYAIPGENVANPTAPPPQPTDGFGAIAAGVVDPATNRVDIVAVSQYRATAPGVGFVNGGSRMTVINGMTGAQVTYLDTSSMFFAKAAPPMIGDVGLGTPVIVTVRKTGGTENQMHLQGAAVYGGSIATVFDATIGATSTTGTQDPTTSPLMYDFRPGHPGKEVVVIDEQANVLYFCQPSFGSGGCTESVATGTRVGGLGAADLDGDGRAELIINRDSGGTRVLPGRDLLTSLSTANTNSAIDPSPLGVVHNAPALGDGDGNGRPDVLNVGSGSAQTQILSYTGASISNPGNVASGGASLGGGALVNLNGADGPEFVFGRPNTMSFFDTNALAQSSTSPIPLPANPMSAPAVGDLNRDCRPEVIFGLAGGQVARIAGVAGQLPTAPRWSSGGIDYDVASSWSAISPGTSPGSGLQAKVAWFGPTSDGGVPLVGYRVYRGTTPTFTPSGANRVGLWPSAVPPTPSNPFIDNLADNLLAGVGSMAVTEGQGDYYYKVGSLTCLSLQGGSGTFDGSVPTDSTFYAEVKFPFAPTLLTGYQYGTPAYAANPSPKVALSWTASLSNVAHPHGCGSVDGYNVYRSTLPGVAIVAANKLNTALVTTTAYTDSTVQAHDPTSTTLYYYRITSVNCVGEQNATTSNEIMLDLRRPFAPTGLTALSHGAPAYSGSLAVSFAWTATSLTPGRGCIDATHADGWIEGYRLYRSADPGMTPKTLVTTIAPVSWTRTLPPAAPSEPAVMAVDSSPVADQLGYYAVAAVNCVGEGPLGSVLTVDNRLPLAPGVATLRAAGSPAYALTPPNLQINITWTAPTSNRGCIDATHPDGWLEGYRIYRNGALLRTVAPVAWPRGTPPLPTAPAVAPGLAFTDTGLTPGFPLSILGTYTYTIKAVNCTGEGPASVMATILLEKPQVPTATATPGATTVNVQWSPTAPNACAMEGYRIYRAPAGGSPALIGTIRPTGIATWPRAVPSSAPANPLPTSGTMSYTDSGLAHETYDFFVSAINCVGESSLSAAARSNVGENLAPTINGPAYITMPSTATTASVASPAQVIAVADVDAQTGDAERVTVSVNVGRISLSGTAGLDFACPNFAGPASSPACFGTGLNEAAMRFRGTLAAVNAALDGLVYDRAGAPCNTPMATLTVTVNDEGNRGYLGASGALARMWQVQVNCAWPPSFTAGGSVVVAEDSGLVSVAGWAKDLMAGAGSATQVRFLLTNDNPGLFSQAPALSPSAFAAGPWPASSLTFRSAPDRCGTAHLTARLEDNGGGAGRFNLSDARPFTIQVTCVNDAPVFTPWQLSIGVDPDGGALSFPGWAGSFGAGPMTAVDEQASQMLRFEVSVADTTLFSALPTVDTQVFTSSPTGALSFAPRPGHYGSTQVQICLRDNGGTANGGFDLSAPCALLEVRVVGPPRANPDCYTLVSSMAQPAPGVASNDISTTGTPPEVQLVSPPANAQHFALHADGSFDYIPRSGFAGSDVFTYRARDGPFASAPATVCLNVLPGSVPLAPMAAFVTDPAVGIAGQPVNFLDASTDVDGQVIGWDWEFEGGGADSGRTVTHTFDEAGIYTILLRVRDDSGLIAAVPQELVVREAETLKAAIPPVQEDESVETELREPSGDEGQPKLEPPVNLPVPTTEFTVTGDGLSFTFSALEATATGHQWDFGDGQTGTGGNAKHDYDAAGDYTVTLTFTAAGEEFTLSKTITAETEVEATRGLDSGLAGEEATAESTGLDLSAIAWAGLGLLGAAAAAGLGALMVVLARRKKTPEAPAE